MDPKWGTCHFSSQYSDQYIQINLLIFSEIRLLTKNANFVYQTFPDTLPNLRKILSTEIESLQTGMQPYINIHSNKSGTSDFLDIEKKFSSNFRT